MKLQEIFGSRIKRSEPLKNHTTYRLGGPADFYFEARSPEEVTAAINAAKEDGLPIFFLGGGSNILVADAGYRGLVITYAVRQVKIEGTRVIADAGSILFALVKASIEAGLTGLEWAAGIPGTVGGAVRGNAGAYGGEIKDNLEAVQAIDLKTGKLQTFNRADCGFGYRESIFKRQPWFVVAAVFTLRAGDKAASLLKIKETVALRQSKQPLEFGSAGSVFKNFVFGEAANIPETIRTDMPSEYIGYGRIPAAWIFKKLGLQGYAIGGAQISTKHTNYFVNTGNATAAEVRELIKYAKLKAKEELNIDLVEEIQYVGF